jgi:Leucine-rich repeat (LRR) protein
MAPARHGISVFQLVLVLVVVCVNGIIVRGFTEGADVRSRAVVNRTCAISQDEYDGLEALYESTNGANWRNTVKKWIFPSVLTSPCSDSGWYGVICTISESGAGCNVTGIELYSDGLQGSLPSQLMLLRNLESLVISGNSLSLSTIPSEIGLISSMTYLDLSDNKIIGEIPSEFGVLGSLTTLMLASNELNGPIPSQLGLLSELTVLSLYVNLLNSSIPCEIYNLTNLEFLVVSSNFISGSISSKIGMLSHLLEFVVSENNFEGPIPTEIGLLGNLRTFGVGNNAITGQIPSELYNCRDLTELSANNNLLTGSISSQLGVWTNLETLELSVNGMFGVLPDEISNCLNIHLISLSSNAFSGTLPAGIGRFSLLEEFSGYSNRFSGPLFDVGNLTNLGSIVANSNLMTGTLSVQFGGLSLLGIVCLSDNSFTGQIPSQFGNISILTSIYLSENMFSGSLSPLLFSKNPAMSAFGVDYNLLSGEIPDTFNGNNWAILYEIYLNNNYFTSTLTDALSTFPVLQLLSLGSNFLTSTLPRTMNNLTSLDALLLYSNLLSGSPFPEAITIFTGLRFLDLSANAFIGPLPLFDGCNVPFLLYDVHDNSFHGSVPQALGYLQAIQSLNLANNSLSGHLPFTLIADPGIQIVILSGNNFNGSIDSIVFGDNITLFDASNNSLTGKFPSVLSPNMQDLSLDNNMLTGSIAVDCSTTAHISKLLIGSNQFTGDLAAFSCFANLSTLSLQSNFFTGSLEYLSTASSLQEIVVYDNELSGNLPDFFANFSSLKVLLLSNNRFSGNPENIFSIDVQILLTAVDISSNDFSGAIPESVFLLPNIQSIAAMKTCFSGSIPSTICSANSLEVLLMDGVTSGLPCQRKFNVIHTSDAYISSKGPLQGGIPDCIWSLPNLKSLHLSSNGLTGTIGIPVQGSNLTTVVLSYNELEGTIPVELQTLPFTTLELSSNRLKGTVTGALAIADAIVNLENNRLSGFLPSSYDNASQVSVMRGNLFDCNKQHPKPTDSADADEEATICGSSQLNDALVVWGACLLATVAVVLCAVLVPYLRSDAKTFLLVVKALVIDCYRAVKSPSATGFDDSELLRILNTEMHTPFYDLLSTIQRLVGFNAFMMVWWSLSCCIPLYLAMKLGFGGAYSTHTYQYLWLVSSTFTTGIFPALALMLLFGTLCGYFYSVVVRSVKSLYPIQASEPLMEIDFQKCRSMWTWRTVISAAVVLCHIIVMTVVNVLYLFVLLSGSYSTSVVTVVQACVSVFKVLWDGFAIPLVLKWIRLSLGAAKNSSSDGIVKFSCSMFSSVIIPFVVSLFANSLCFLDVLIPQSVVTENFFFNVASEIPCVEVPIPTPNITIAAPPGVLPPTPPSTVTECFSFVSAGELSTEFFPPFAYSYQCGSGILTSYIPVLLYSLAFRLLLLTGRQGVHFMNRKMSGNYARLPARFGEVLGSAMLDVLIIMTFGLSSPAVVVVLMCCTVLELSWFFTKIIEFLGLSEGTVTEATIPGVKLETLYLACDGICDIPLRTMWVCMHVSSVFWALLLFDIIGDGDVHHPAKALWGPIIVLMIPILLRLYHAFGPKAQQRQPTNDAELRKVDVDRASSTSLRVGSTSISRVGPTTVVSNPIFGGHHTSGSEHNSDFL